MTAKYTFDDHSTNIRYCLRLRVHTSTDNMHNSTNDICFSESSLGIFIH